MKNLQPQALAWQSANVGAGMRGAKVPAREGSLSFLRPRQLEEQTLQLETLGVESAFISPEEGGSVPL